MIRKENIQLMKPFRILSRNIRDAFKSVARNFSLSFASILCTTITLVLVAIAIAISYNVNTFTKHLEEELTIVVFLDRSATEEEIEMLQSKIISNSNVEESIFKSKEETKEEMMKDSEVYEAIMSSWTKENNPLQDSFIIRVKDINSIKKTANEIAALEKVDAAKYGEEMVDKMLSIFNVVEKVTIVIVGALIIVTAFLISNTIKLTIFSRRNEIEIMRLVGTSNIVIRLPFFFEGFILGVIGSIIPVITAIYGYYFAYEKLGGYLFTNLIKLTPPTPFAFYIALLVLGIGVVVGGIGSWRAVRKYLKI